MNTYDFGKTDKLKENRDFTQKEFSNFFIKFSLTKSSKFIVNEITCFVHLENR